MFAHHARNPWHIFFSADCTTAADSFAKYRNKASETLQQRTNTLPIVYFRENRHDNSCGRCPLKTKIISFNLVECVNSIKQCMQTMPIQRFIDGFKAFREEYYSYRPDFFKNLVDQGQNPSLMVIACSDSRVDPSIILNAEPGEMFVVRNIAGLVPAYESNNRYHGTSAAIEFGVRDLKVHDIVVLGHSFCGGIKRLCECDDVIENRHFISSWMSTLQDFDRHGLKGEELLRHAEKEAIKISVGNLMTFPWLKDRVYTGQLTLPGWLFELEAGNLLQHTPENKWSQL